MHQTFSSLLKKGFQQIVVQKNIGPKSQLKADFVVRRRGYRWIQRRRARGEFRHNMHQVLWLKDSVTNNEKQLVAPLSRHLTRAGIRFAGIDILGGYILKLMYKSRRNVSC